MFDLGKIDQFLESLKSAKNDDELRILFATYDCQYDLSVPSDPTSDEYRQKQFELYESLAGKKYTDANEVSEFDGEDGDGCLIDSVDNKFYYSSGTFSTAYSGYTIIVRITLPNDSAPVIKYLELKW